MLGNGKLFDDWFDLDLELGWHIVFILFVIFLYLPTSFSSISYCIVIIILAFYEGNLKSSFYSLQPKKTIMDTVPLLKIVG